MKRVLFCFMYIFIAFFCFAATKETDMVSLFPDSRVVYPSNGDFENIVDVKFDEDLLNFKTELAKEFDIQWCDDNFDPYSRKALAKSTSPILSELLPAKDVLFSHPVVMQTGEKSFRIKNAESGKIYAVILSKGKIISITKI